MTQPGRPALFRDALGGRDGTQAPSLPFTAPRVYWDPTLSAAPRRVPVVAPPLPAAPIVIDPSLFAVPPSGATSPAPARQPRAVQPTRMATASTPAAIRPAAPVPARMSAPPPVAWPTPTSSTAWSASGPSVAAVPGTGYSPPVLPVGPPKPLNVIPPGGQVPPTNSQQVLRDAMRVFNQQLTPNRAANRSQASAKGCASAIFWLVLLIVVGVLFQSGTFGDLLDQIFR